MRAIFSYDRSRFLTFLSTLLAIYWPTANLKDRPGHIPPLFVASLVFIVNFTDNCGNVYEEGL